jgi:hypothetical protein
MAALAGSLPETMVWLDPEQVPLVRAVAESIGLPIVAAGSPIRGRSREVAAALAGTAGQGDVEPIDDLRAGLAATSASAVWIAAAGTFGGESAAGADLEALRACRARGIRIATMEPIPASALELAAAAAGLGPVGDDAGAPELVRFVPRARLARAVLEAAEVLSAFGPVRTLAFEAWSGRGEGSLGSRLVDAMDVVSWLLGEPETIDAAYMWPGKGVRESGGFSAPPDGVGADGAAHGAGGGLHLLPAETLRGLHGDMTLNCRFADGRGAAVVISDQAGRWNRALMLVGPGGRIRVYDDGFEWVAPDGTRVDASRGLGAGRSDSVGSAAGGAAPGRSAAVIAEALDRYLGHREGAVPPLDGPRVLAMAGAALLSARTGESESPATIARMASLAG